MLLVSRKISTLLKQQSHLFRDMKTADIDDWLKDYFQKNRRPFPWNKLNLENATPFEKIVWKALWEIPFGETCSYQEIARKIGKPKASRAVGQANGRNPLPVLIPCHRVISADGSLGGYSGGLKIKKFLLDHEK